MVKADAYGLGAVPVVRTLEAAGCEHFFVAHFSEALEIKPALEPRAKIFVLNGLQHGMEADCGAAQVIPVINSLEQASDWLDLARKFGGPLPAAIQIDTGMARFGLSSKDVDVLLAGQFFHFVPPALVMSHLACADDAGSQNNDDQAVRFATLASRLPAAPRSIANSAGVFLGSEFHGDLARLGICLYGAAPVSGLTNPMAPVVRLDASVIQVRDIEPGQGVGYGLTNVANTPRRIATIGVGYADGWPRALSNAGAAYYEGVCLPIVGRVSMDSMMLDVSVLDHNALVLQAGDMVELLGPHQTLEDVAQAAGTIPYEILTRLGRRYQRTYLKDAAREHGLARPADTKIAS